MSKRPLVSAQARPDDPSRILAARRDWTYIEGYSDVRAEIDEHIRKGLTPPRQLKHRLQLVTAVNPRSGRPDMTKATEFSGMGYKAMKFDEAAGMGYNLPPTAFKTADGGIQIGDTLLYYCDAATAEQHWQDGRSAIEEASTVEATSSQLLSAGQALGGGHDLASATLEQKQGPLK